MVSDFAESWRADSPEFFELFDKILFHVIPAHAGIQSITLDDHIRSCLSVCY